jgi:peptidoglycan lytic transglycosylase
VGPKAPAFAVASQIWHAPRIPRARLILAVIGLCCAATSLTGCGGGNGEKLGERVIPLGQPVPKGGGSYRLGEPYQVAGTWYRPREDPSYDRVGTASWYGELFQGRRTANGEIYDMDRLSAASPTLPLPVYARVTNLDNNRSIVVRVNDRGPYASSRIMDVSRRSAEALGFRERGTTRVRVQYLGRAPLNGDDSYERRYLASQSQGWTQVASNRGAPARQPEPVAVSSIGETRPLSRPASTRSLAQLRPAPIQPAKTAGGVMIQAGSFRDQDNAERARSVLGAIAAVEVAPIEGGSGRLFRVRLGPFADEQDAAAALPLVAEAGYGGARIVPN